MLYLQDASQNHYPILFRSSIEFFKLLCISCEVLKVILDTFSLLKTNMTSNGFHFPVFGE